MNCVAVLGKTPEPTDERERASMLCAVLRRQQEEVLVPVREYAYGDDPAVVVDEFGFREVVFRRWRDQGVEVILLAVVPEQRIGVVVSARSADDLIAGVVRERVRAWEAAAGAL